MITADTNIFVEYFRGRESSSTKLLEKLLQEHQLVMNPFVLSELISSPKLPGKIEKNLLSLPQIEIQDGFFERAGHLRRKIYTHGKGVPMADVFIAQSCIDSNVSLLTDDQDLEMISKHSSLSIVKF